MGTRGRKSTAELAVIGPDGIQRTPRPEPPATLGADASRLWRSICNALPADALHPGALPVLEGYCVLATSLRRTLRALDKMEQTPREVFDGEAWRALQRQAAELAQRVTMIATRLRLTPQSLVHPVTAGRRARAVAPPSAYDLYLEGNDRETE
jgi:phage terminase small subunit